MRFVVCLPGWRGAVLIVGVGVVVVHIFSGQYGRSRRAAHRGGGKRVGKVGAGLHHYTPCFVHGLHGAFGNKRRFEKDTSRKQIQIVLCNRCLTINFFSKRVSMKGLNKDPQWGHYVSTSVIKWEEKQHVWHNGSQQLAGITIEWVKWPSVENQVFRESYFIQSHIFTVIKIQINYAPSSMSWSSVSIRMMFGRTFRRSLWRRDLSLLPERYMVPSVCQRKVRMKKRRRVAGLHPTAMAFTLPVFISNTS